MCLAKAAPAGSDFSDGSLSVRERRIGTEAEVHTEYSSHGRPRPTPNRGVAVFERIDQRRHGFPDTQASQAPRRGGADLRRLTSVIEQLYQHGGINSVTEAEFSHGGGRGRSDGGPGVAKGPFEKREVISVGPAADDSDGPCRNARVAVTERCKQHPVGPLGRPTGQGPDGFQSLFRNWGIGLRGDLLLTAPKGRRQQQEDQYSEQNQSNR